MVLCSASQESIGAAPSGSVTCAGTPTGSVLTYDNERRLATWQNTPSNPTSTAAYWYDGEGNRVAQTLNGVTTYYVGNDEEITGATLLKYYHIPGLPVLGTITGVTRTYLASDGLGSETVDLSYNGTVLATALYGPYGVGRYATGTMPTSRGYTGQRQDSGSGLDYYGARYYDALVGQFTSADTFQGPNRYVYVGGNPETATDPTGKMRCDDTGACGDNEALAPNSDGVHFVGPALDPSAFVGGAANFGWRAYRAEQAYWNIPTVFVNGYTRSNGTRVNDYWRRAPGDGARAADAGDTAAKWARAGRVISGVL